MPQVMTGREPDGAATLGGRLRTAREARGWSVAQLAGRVGVTVTTVARWERDRSRPRLRQLEAVARALGLPLSWFGDPAAIRGRSTPPARLAAVAERVARVLTTLCADRASRGRREWPAAGVPRE